MHELPMTERLAEIVLEHAGRAGAHRVTDVHVVIGELSGASAECIGFYWDVLVRDTAAEGAALHFRQIPFELVCLDCGREFPPRGGEFRCAGCGGAKVRPARGDELYVEAIEVTGHDEIPGTLEPGLGAGARQ